MLVVLDIGPRLYVLFTLAIGLKGNLVTKGYYESFCLLPLRVNSFIIFSLLLVWLVISYYILTMILYVFLKAYFLGFRFTMNRHQELDP